MSRLKREIRDFKIRLKLLRVNIKLLKNKIDQYYLYKRLVIKFNKLKM